MQEEIAAKSIALSSKTIKLTSRGLYKMVLMYLKHHKNKQVYPDIPKGKQTVKQLAEKDSGMSCLDMKDEGMRIFHRTMKKYSIDYAVTKNKNTDPPTHTVFFKGKDSDVITKAFEEFTEKITKTKDKKRPSLLAKLHKLVSKVKLPKKDRDKRKEREQTR